MFHRRARVLIASALAAAASWCFIPGTALDQTALKSIIRKAFPPQLFISGNGSHSQPWKVQAFTAKPPPGNMQTLPVVALGDDIEGFFQSSPVSPIDLAVIFKNIQRLGVKRSATATLLAWDKPDPIGLAAMEKAMSGFESIVVAAPLSRGAVPDPIPPAFRRASVSINSVHGHTASIPIVNRIPLPGIILGGDQSFAGFQSLDSETATGWVPLIARWNDRVVFAFPVVTLLKKLNLPPEGVEIRLGRFIKLGEQGPVIPIDGYGRMAIQLQPVSPRMKIPAETLVDADKHLFADRIPDFLILIDDRTTAEPATREFSKQVPTLINTITNQPPLTEARVFPRPPVWLEILGLAMFIVLLSAMSSLPAMARIIAAFNLALICLAVQYQVAQTAHLWLPGIHVLAATCAAMMFSIGKKSA